MSITVFGASGRVGRLVVGTAQWAGVRVTAAVRDPAAVPDFRAVQIDLADPSGESVLRAVDGVDAVISCVGATSAAEAGAAELAAVRIIDAMKVAGVRRLLAISASPVASTPSPGRPSPEPEPGDSLFVRLVALPLVKRIFAKSYADLARMEDVIRTSDFDWTIFRPPRLTDGNNPRYRSSIGRGVRGGTSISRIALATAMIDAVDEPATYRQHIGIASRRG